MLSASCHYGLQAMLYIACHSENGKNADLKSIAVSESIPSHFLSKILQELVRKKLLVSTKGPAGGYRLAREASAISLFDVIKAIDGPDIFERCGILNRTCSKDNPCILHKRFQVNMENIKQLYITEKVNCIKIILNEAGVSQNDV